MFRKTKKSKMKKVMPTRLAKAKAKRVGRQGFTLIEVIVAVFIFALMASAASGVFVKMIQSYRYAKVAQKDLESAQYAMNLMAKTLRTSSVDDSGALPAPSSILIYDYSQGKCIEYAFDSLHHRVYSQEAVPADFNSVADCLAAGPYSTPSTIAENVDGKFDYTASSDGVAMGKVTISMTVSSGSKDTNIQSSVSLRDYPVAGI